MGNNHYSGQGLFQYWKIKFIKEIKTQQSSVYLKGLLGIVQHLMCIKEITMDLLCAAVAETLKVVLQLPAQTLNQLQLETGEMDRGGETKQKENWQIFKKIYQLMSYDII